MPDWSGEKGTKESKSWKLKKKMNENLLAVIFRDEDPIQDFILEIALKDKNVAARVG